jgi:hypothetical protein
MEITVLWGARDASHTGPECVGAHAPDVSLPTANTVHAGGVAIIEETRAAVATGDPAAENVRLLAVDYAAGLVHPEEHAGRSLGRGRTVVGAWFPRVPLKGTRPSRRSAAPPRGQRRCTRAPADDLTAHTTAGPRRLR